MTPHNCEQRRKEFSKIYICGFLAGAILAFVLTFPILGFVASLVWSWQAFTIAFFSSLIVSVAAGLYGGFYKENEARKEETKA